MSLAYSITKTNKEIAERLATKYMDKYGGIAIALSESEIQATPQQLLDELATSQFVLIGYGANGEEYIKDEIALNNIHNHFAQRKHKLANVTFGLSQHIRVLSNLSASVIHNLIAVKNYADLYTKIKGKMPTKVFEAGFGQDHTGQLIYCAVKGIVFSGLSADKSCKVDLSEVAKTARLIGIPSNFQNSTGDIIYESTLECAIIDATYPLVFSNLVLEHLEKPFEFMAKSFAITESGGMSIHTVGMCGHSYGVNPYDFLYMSNDEYQQYRKDNPGYAVRNRLRLDDWLALLKKVGFSRVDHVIISTMDIPPDLQERYGDKDISANMVRFECYKD